MSTRKPPKNAISLFPTQEYQESRTWTRKGWQKAGVTVTRIPAGTTPAERKRMLEQAAKLAKDGIAYL